MRMTEKQKYVYQIFDSIVEKYELLNTVLSLGQDRYWRKFTADIASIKPNNIIIDICTGTGSLAFELARHLVNGKVVGIDFCDKMVEKAREKLINSPYKSRIEFIKGFGEDIPFDDNIFDCATIAFGLRNVDNIKRTFREMQRVVKPGGKIISLELVIPSSWVIKLIYYPYLKIIPFIGRIISKKKVPYQYLSESIGSFFSSQELANIMTEVGLKNVSWYNLSGGIAAIHIGYKPYPRKELYYHKLDNISHNF
jgi:demethylmenaquinone methyltransferase/2-methoxy-6-polyprenyl-1,4-benzoquinol methylase